MNYFDRKIEEVQNQLANLAEPDWDDDEDVRDFEAVVEGLEEELEELQVEAAEAAMYFGGE